MKVKYYCGECSELYNEKDIDYKYRLNVDGKFPVWEYVCKRCADKEGGKKW